MEGEETNPPPDILYRSRQVGAPWDTIEHVTQTTDPSVFPVIVAGTYAVWAESLAGGQSYDWEVFGARRRQDGIWEQLGDLSSTPDEDSRFPQAAFWQDADTGYLYVAWGEGDSAPFAVMVRRFEVPSVPGWGERTTAGVEEGFPRIPLPRVFALSQNYPNPCREFTIINYQLSKPVRATLKVYDISGRLIRTLVDEEQKPGFYTATWNGRDSSGRQVASGVYFYRLTARQANGGEACDFTATRRMVLVR